MKLNLAPVLFITAVLFLSAETTFRPEWGSLLFLIPNQLTDLGRKCATKRYSYLSIYYPSPGSNFFAHKNARVGLQWEDFLMENAAQNFYIFLVCQGG